MVNRGGGGGEGSGGGSGENVMRNVVTLRGVFKAASHIRLKGFEVPSHSATLSRR